MKKADLISAMAEEAGITRQQASTALDSFESSLKAAVLSDGKFALPGIGTFKKAKRAARTGTTNGVAWAKPEHFAVTFKAAPALKDSVN